MLDLLTTCKELNNFSQGPSRFKGLDIHVPQGYAKRRGCLLTRNFVQMWRVGELFLAMCADLGRYGHGSTADLRRLSIYPTCSRAELVCTPCDAVPKPMHSERQQAGPLRRLCLRKGWPWVGAKVVIISSSSKSVLCCWSVFFLTKSGHIEDVQCVGVITRGRSLRIRSGVK